MPRLHPARTALALAGFGLVGLVGLGSEASAHTESDVVAVPAGAAATVALRPTHGCGTSPTVEVSTRVPVPGAVPVEVAGWTATATPDGERTVLEWTGGSLPADRPGDFPVRFTVPATVGEVLTFPFVQVCADGSELAWIDGDPSGERPAPMLLVLAAGSTPARSLEEVPADAPGRDQLAAVLDVDNPAVAPTTPSTAPATAPTPAEATTTVAPTEGDGGGLPIVVPVVAGLLAGTALVALRRRSRTRAG